MKKETVIEDAITYIRQLKGRVLFLCDQVLQVEPLEEEETKPKIDENAAEEMKNCGIEVVAASPHLIIMNCSSTYPAHWYDIIVAGDLIRKTLRWLTWEGISYG